MSFTDYIYVTVQNLKSSLQAGLNAFFDARRMVRSSIPSKLSPRAGNGSSRKHFRSFFKVLLTVSTKKPNWLTGKATNCLGSMVPG